MKLCHEESDGLSILNEETGQLEEAMHVEFLDGACGVMLYDCVYHALALAKRGAMDEGRGGQVHAHWVLLNECTVGGKPSKRPRLHFADFTPCKRGKPEYLGGCTLILKAKQLPTPAEVAAANEDPLHPLWDLVPQLHPNYEETP